MTTPDFTQPDDLLEQEEDHCELIAFTGDGTTEDVAYIIDGQIVQLSAFDYYADYRAMNIHGDGLGYASFFKLQPNHETQKISQQAVGEDSTEFDSQPDLGYESVGTNLPELMEPILLTGDYDTIDEHLDNDDGHTIVQLHDEDSSVILPTTDRFEETHTAVHHSAVDEDDLTLNTVYGNINLGDFDGAIVHTADEPIVCELEFYIDENYTVCTELVDGETTVADPSPSDLLFYFETRQITLYRETSNGINHYDPSLTTYEETAYLQECMPTAN